MSRFTAAGVKILERTASEEEMNDYVTEATRAKSAEPSLEKQLEELEGELAKARQGAQRLQEGLDRVLAESDELRKKLHQFPTKMFGELTLLLTEEARSEMLAAKQWVMVVAPTTDLANWTTMAEYILRYKITTIRSPSGWAVVLGSWRPDTKTAEELKAHYGKDPG